MLLVVGSSEAGLFYKNRKFIQEKYGMPVIVRNFSGCTLDQCVDLIHTHMSADIKIILIWSLTTLAWRMKPFFTYRSTPTLAYPRDDFSIEGVPVIMDSIIAFVHSKNPNCDVYLVIPTVKDLFTFNQTRLEKFLGPNHNVDLKDHPILGRRPMREHSCNVHEYFMSLQSDQYIWREKKYLVNAQVISRYYDRVEDLRNDHDSSPQNRYLKRRSMYLNVALLDDGLHGNDLFLEWFFKKHIKFLRESWEKNKPSPSVRRVEFSGSRSDAEERAGSVLGPTPPKRFNRTISPVRWPSSSVLASAVGSSGTGSSTSSIRERGIEMEHLIEQTSAVVPSGVLPAEMFFSQTEPTTPDLDRYRNCGAGLNLLQFGDVVRGMKQLLDGCSYSNSTVEVQTRIRVAISSLIQDPGNVDWILSMSPLKNIHPAQQK